MVMDSVPTVLVEEIMAVADARPVVFPLTRANAPWDGLLLAIQLSPGEPLHFEDWITWHYAVLPIRRPV